MHPNEELIAASRGEIEVDLLLSGGSVANLLSGEVHRADVAIFQGRIAGFDCLSAREVMDVEGKILAPGFIDAHVHIESSMVTIPEYARAVVPRGTTTVICDPHEIANVWGEAGVSYMLEAAKGAALNVYVMLPTCVPATDLESSGSVLDADALAALLPRPGVLGLAEVMNYPGVIFRDPEVMKKLSIADERPVEGHAPGLTGRDLAAYISAGINSDHECTSMEEVREKLRAGLYIMLREGSAAKNLIDLLPAVTARNARQFMFVSDDRHPADILCQGHIDFMVKTAIKKGLDPILALQIASLNPARYFGLADLGAIAVGYRADIAVLEDLEDLRIASVLKDGAVAAEEGRFTARQKGAISAKYRPMQIKNINLSSFAISAGREGHSKLARVIGVVPHQIITRSLLLTPLVRDGKVVSDTDRDILKMAVVERHRGTGNVGLGLVQGFGLHCGAIASSVAHDSHNIAVVGTGDEDMLAAVLAVKENGGGLAAVAGGRTLAALALPVAGLLSEEPMQQVAEKIEQCIEAALSLGCSLADPFMTLSFLCLPVIPELKLTDRGLVDVGKFKLVGLLTNNL